jgi:WD40 repeat protein
MEDEVIGFYGHNNNVNSVVWLPNGKQVASASSDKTVQVWDAFTGHALMTFPATASVMAVAVSHDGNEIAWSGKDGITEVWRIAPQTHLLTYTGQAGSGGIWGLAFSHDGKVLAAGDNTGNIQVFDAKSGKTVLNYTKHTKAIYGLDWSPNDHFIASASEDGWVRVWNASTGETVHSQTRNMVPMHAVSWSPDGTHVASASEDGTVQVWNAFTDGGNPFVYHHHSGIVYTVAWSPDGNKIASGDANGDIQVWWAK